MGGINYPVSRQSQTSHSFHQLIVSRFGRCPKAGEGVNRWTNRVVLSLLARGCSYAEIQRSVRYLTRECGRPTERDVNHSLETARQNLGLGNGGKVLTPLSELTSKPKWPKRDQDYISKVLQEYSGFSIADLKNASPVKNPSRLTATILLPQLFSKNSLICCAVRKDHHDGGGIASVESWVRSGVLGRYQLIVPSAMRSLWGRKQDGGLSHRAVANVGDRRFIVTEFDFGTADQQAAIIMHLAKYAPLALVVHSAGKSLHGWFYCFGQPDSKVSRFFRYSCRLGADPAKWSPNQLVRLPGGWRLGSGRQEAFYFDPETLA